jgi:signal transduction histidine kinase/DNA-binding NarL/FixJ family response regulator
MNPKSKKILIIEDDPDVRLATKTYLELAGYKNIAEAENGDAGLARIREDQPALVLLDRKMPGKDGLQVLDEIKEIYGDDIEVIMLTAYRDKSYITEAMRKSAFYYLVKDENPDIMLHAIENALRYQQKAMQRKAIEREIFELLIDNQELIANGYNFVYFKKVLREKIGELVEDVIRTAITECAGCTNPICQNCEALDALPQFSTRLANAARGDYPPLFFLQRESNHPFYRQALKTYVAEAEQNKVQTLLYVPFVDHPSPPLVKLLDEKQLSNNLIRYCCIFVFSAQALSLSPEEKRLLRSFFGRFLAAMRMAKLVSKIEWWDKNRLLGEMAAMVVHQISPLITPLMNCLQEPDAKKQAQGLAMIKDLRSMIDDFREYNNGIVKDYHFAPQDLIQIIKQAETMLFLQIDQQIAIDHEFPEARPMVYADADRLHQVFSNLFINAAQALAVAKPSKSRITIQVNKSGNMAEVRMKDNGAGVPGEIVPKLFSSYVSTKTGGMGLGLCLAHEILRRHGGRIEYNAAYSEGAEFIVTLPVIQNEALAEA